MPGILELPAPKADERIAYGSLPSQFGDLWLPATAAPHPLLVYIHGGFWRVKYDLTHAGHVCHALRRQGFAVWNLEYRRIGEAGPWSKSMDDVLLGAQHVAALAKPYNLDLDFVLAAGHSAGGQLALWLAAQPAAPSLRGVASLAGVCDLRRAWELQLSFNVVEEFLGGSPKQVPARYAFASPTEIKVPQHLIHGTSDANVPFELSERLAARSKNARLTLLKGADHFALIDPRSSVWPIVQKGILEW